MAIMSQPVIVHDADCATRFHPGNACDCGYYLNPKILNGDKEQMRKLLAKKAQIIGPQKPSH
jgi:hypothetical protein